MAQGQAGRAPQRNYAARATGYDMFISFALGAPPRGTQSYASDLARRLRDRDFAVFFSEDEAPPGEPLTPTLRTALHRARMLVVVANRGTLLEPRWVRTEVEEFRARHPSRPVIPINVGGALEDPALATTVQSWLGHQEKIWLDEAEQAVADGIASEPLVERLTLAPTWARANVRWRWLVRGAIAVLLLLAATVGAALFAWHQRDHANRIAQSGRLAAQAGLLLERGGPVDVSVMLAAEGLRGLTAIGERSLEVDRSLRVALALLPRFQGEVESPDKVRLTPAGDHLVAGAEADQISVRRLVDGQLRSCRREDITIPNAPARIRLVTAASSNGDWCVVREMDTKGNQAILEVWSARPLAKVVSLTMDSKAGHVYPAISDDGELLAVTDHAQTGTGDTAAATFRLWSRTLQAELLRVEGEKFLGFSPDGRHFATTSGLWHRPPGGEGRPNRIISWEKPPSGLAFSPDGAQVATRSDYDSPVEVWDVAAAKLLRATPARKGELLAVAEDGRFLLLGTNLETLLWDSRDEAPWAQIPLKAVAGPFASVEPPLLAEDVAGYRFGPERLRVLSLPAWGAALAGTLLAPEDQVEWLGLRGDAVDLLIATGGGRRLEAWDFRQGSRRVAAALPTGPWAVSGDGRHLAIAAAGKVGVSPIGAPGAPVEISLETEPERLALSGDGAYLAAASGDTLRVWRLADRQQWRLPPLPGPSLAIMVSRDGAYALAVVTSRESNGERSRAGQAYALMRWRLADPADAVTVDLGRSLLPPSLLCAVSDDGRALMVGGTRHEITAGMALPAGLNVESPQCATTGPRLATEGSRVVVFAASGQPRVQLDHGAPVLASAIGTDCRHVATVTEGRGVQIFALDPAELIAQACARQPRPLTAGEWHQYLGAEGPATDACGRPRPEEEEP